MYKFCMANGCWWRVCTTLNELFEHHEATDNRYGNAIIEDVYANGEKYKGIRDAARLYGENNNISFIEGLSMLSSMCFSSQAKMINEGHEVWINENGGWNTGLQAIATVYMKKIIYPNYTKKDIRISKFGNNEGGKHYYAHIGDVEIFDYVDGEKVIKWDTYNEAYQNALRYCAELE